MAFGDHRPDLEGRELRRGGELIAIEPKAFDLLAYLVQHDDRVVTRDDLLEAMWDGRNRLGIGADDTDQCGATGLDDAALQCARSRHRPQPQIFLRLWTSRFALNHLNRPKEAITSAHQAIRLSPRDPALFSFCSTLALARSTLGRYEEGLRRAEAALRENSELPSLRLKLSLCGHLDRVREAQDCLHRMGKVYATPAIAVLLRDLPKGLAPEIAALIIEGLRKAGVPEN